uniref:Uncharacterized protein n=1 Tax=Siphoviridae sp. ctx254 TaxID=2825737 RepID=A0A8S5TVP8_9CAUD|nr:MAG TPA: hypothetical protein [Siphoviridae sp. ctx254]
MPKAIIISHQYITSISIAFIHHHCYTKLN